MGLVDPLNPKISLLIIKRGKGVTFRYFKGRRRNMDIRETELRDKRSHPTPNLSYGHIDKIASSFHSSQ